jgi:hypothetical protein
MKVILIGRSKDNDIVVNDDRVSRNHLQIVQNDTGGYSVVDLGSVNGTFVNGQRIASETHLQPGDVIKIGNTILPWQSYPPIITPPVTEPKPEPEPKPKPKRTILYIAAAVTILLLVGGGFALKVYNNKKQEKIEAENKAKAEETERLQQETVQKETEAKRLQEEADKLREKALISQSETDKKLAEEAQKKANIAKDEATIAKAAQQKAEKERDEAVKARKAAEAQSKKDKEAKAEAEKARQEAETKTKEAEKAKAEAEKTLNEQQAELNDLKTEREKKDSDFESLFNDDRFKNIEPKNQAGEKNKNDWKEMYKGTFKQKQKVYNELLSALEKKATDAATKKAKASTPIVQPDTTSNK